MLELIVLVVRAIVAGCGGHHDLVLENIALRQQLRILQRAPQPHLRPRDRMFWVLLSCAWRRWRTALVLVQPETVIRWHREWLRRGHGAPVAIAADADRWIRKCGD